MTNTQTAGWFSAKNLTLIILIFTGLYLVVSNLVDSRFSEIEASANELATAQHESLLAMTEMIESNSVDSVTRQLVRDCSIAERQDFEGLLNRLNDNLNETELIQLQGLFGRCSSFHSDRRLVMVSRFEREIQVYENYINQLSVITDSDKASELGLERWYTLLEMEAKRADLFSKLAPLQGNIITTLQTGKSSDSSEIAEILQEVIDVKGSLFVVNKQTDKVRTELVPL